MNTTAAAGQDVSRRLLISVSVMLATVMQVLDMTIVNVALPHMAGELNSTSDQITWVLTSYLVASAIFMPLTGYFAGRFGRKRVMLVSIVGFVLASMACGLSQNLLEMVIGRLIQGAFGAALVPLSQSIMVDTFPREERGKAMAIWGMGVMVGPILGPTLGGYLTEIISWRWVFFINLPVGIMSAALGIFVIRESDLRSPRMDWMGLMLLSVGIGSLQFMLDRGTQDDWFSSSAIRFAAIGALVGLLWFIIRGWRTPHSLIDLHLFKDRNFATACLLIAAFGLGLFGTIAIQPMLLEELLNYPVLTTGLIMAPRGIASMLSMMLVGRLIARVDPRILISIGLGLAALGTYASTYYSLEIDVWWAIWPGIVQGLGLGMVFVPLSTIAYDTLPPQVSAEAAGIFSLLRTLGSSIGISIVSTVLTRQTQVSWNQLGGHVNPFNPNLAHYLHRLPLPAADPATFAIIAREIGRQARMLAFLDVYMMITWSFILMFPLLLFVKFHKKGMTGTPHAAMD